MSAKARGFITTSLNRKLIRDLGEIKGQGIAIGLVMAMGVLILVMMGGVLTSLEEARRTYYEEYRFADIFAPLVRAPNALAKKIESLEGVQGVQASVRGKATVDLRGLMPIAVQVQSLPEKNSGRLNAVYVVQGRRLLNASDEVLLLSAFAKAHNLKPGDSLQLTLNGVKLTQKIVGLVNSPEHVYVTPPGSIAPDLSAFAVIWMGENALSDAYGLNGAFNFLSLSLGPFGEQESIIHKVDSILEPYGGTGAYDRQEQLSNRFLQEELNSLQGTNAVVPPVFLSVAAFLLGMVIARLVQADREKIGVMKAFGYTSQEIAWHYAKLVLVVALSGACLGVAGSLLIGPSLVLLYQDYFQLPEIIFRVEITTLIFGFAVSVMAAFIGASLPLRQIFALQPAVAMRPPVPISYRSSQRLARVIAPLNQSGKMIARRLLRQPLQAGGTLAGLAISLALSLAMLNTLSSFDYLLKNQFDVLDRSDLAVYFYNPISRQGLFDLQRMPGVDVVEASRQVPVVFRFGHREYQASLEGIDKPILRRPLDHTGKVIHIPSKGIVLSQPIADILGITLGDRVSVEFQTGLRQTVFLPVVDIANSLLGAPSYMNLASLNKNLGEPGAVSHVHIKVRGNKLHGLVTALKESPVVAEVSLKNKTRAALEKMMNTGAGVMRFIMSAIAGVMAFGIVYTSARIAFSERYQDFTSLRVLGFSKGESTYVLFGELGILLLLSLPIGIALGQLLGVIIGQAFSSDLYQIQVIFSVENAILMSVVMLVTSLLSAGLVSRDCNRESLALALKRGE